MQVIEVKVKEVYKIECSCGFNRRVEPFGLTVSEVEYNKARSYFLSHVFEKNHFNCVLKLVKEEQN